MRRSQYTMFLRALCFCVFCLLGFSVHSQSSLRFKGGKNIIPEKEIHELAQAIKAASSYREDFRRELDQIEDSLLESPSEEMRCILSLKLAKRFRLFNTDSSLYYAHKAQAIAESLNYSYQHKAAIATIGALSTAGLFTDAIQLFNVIGKYPLEEENKVDYWLAGHHLYDYMVSYTQGNEDISAKYRRLAEQYDDSLLLYLPKSSQLRTYLECERFVERKQYHEAQEGLEKLLATLPQQTNLYGMTAYQMAQVWLHLGDETRYAALLALSALSDVKGCVGEGLALPTLAEWLYQKGELSLSFAFINFALEKASSSNARMRAVTVARMVPLIDDAYNDRIKESRDELMVYFLMVTILLIVTAVLIVFLIKQVKKTKASAHKLALTSRRQESYIANFIGLYSGYADKLNRFSKLVSTKLAAGQAAELKKLMDSGRFNDTDNEDIHKIFDTAFLDIYPDFIANINSLLRPEEEIIIKTPGTLTPELRIYAFVKLGIDESNRISQILHYSVNTVYAYRNKMRNKAIHRENFDSDVKKL